LRRRTTSLPTSKPSGGRLVEVVAEDYEPGEGWLVGLLVNQIAIALEVGSDNVADAMDPEPR
jgi:hypothetical protein